MEMEAPKKRKRDAPLPVVCYDAESRTFDRVFKEESLDAMKSVVRKKLNISSSTSVSLAQVRDGKTVDLEDDEDFEAFSAFAHISSAVKVKVTLGENVTALAIEQTDAQVSASVAEGRKRKKKKKRAKDSNTGLISVVNAPPTLTATESSPENEVPQKKKRRVSFAESLPHLKGKIGAESSATNSEEASGEVQTPALAAFTVDSVGEKDETSNLSKKKEKKKKVENNVQKESVTEEDQSIPETSEKQKKKKSKKLLDSSDAPEINQVQTTDEAPQNNPKKRSRNELESEENESIPPSATKTIAEGDSDKRDDDEPPTKKSKKKTTETSDSAHAVHQDAASSNLPTNLLDSAQNSHKTKHKKKTTTAEETLSVEADKNEAETIKRPKKSKASKPDVQMAVEESLPVVEKRKKSKNVVDTESSNKSLPDTVPENYSDEIALAAANNPSIHTDAENFKGGRKRAKDMKVVEADKEKETGAASKIEKTSKKKKNLDNTDSIGEKQDTVAQGSTKLSRLEAAKARMNELLAAHGVRQTETGQIPPPASSHTESSLTQNVPAKIPSQTDQLGGEHADQPTVAQVESNIAVEPPILEDTSKNGNSSAISAPKHEKPPSTCPVCDASPLHARSRCPIIKAGIRSMRKRIAELEGDGSEPTNDQRSVIIAELHTLIEKKTKKPRVSEALKHIVPTSAGEPLTVIEANVAEVEVTPVEPPVVSTKKPRKSRVSEVAKAPTSHIDVQSPVVPEVEDPVAVTSRDTSPVPNFLPATQPGLKSRMSLGQAANVSPLSIQASSSNKAATSSQSPFLSPLKVSEGHLRPDFLGFGDISKYSDRDLEAIIRGPRPSLIQDIPESDSEDENSNQEEVVLEEEDIQGANVTRNSSRIEYPSSSDAGDEDEEDEEAVAGPILPQSLHRSQADLHVEGGDLSFRDVNENGSSVEPDNSGNGAVNEAVDADLAPLTTNNRREDHDESDSDEDSNFPIDSELVKDSQTPNMNLSVPINVPALPSRNEENVHDPIEPSDDAIPPPSQPELIVSYDDPHPSESTPKAEVTTRTRSQRVKSQGIAKTAAPAATQETKQADDSEVIKPARKTRSLTKLTDLPVPPNPSARVIRPSATPATNLRTRRQLATAREQSLDREPTPEETGTVGRTTRAAASRAAKTPAKTPVKAAKTPAKAPAKTPAKATKTTTAKPLSKQATQSPAKTQGRPAATSVEPVKSESEKLPVENNTANESVAEWAVLQDNAPSQVDTDAAMVDELLPSPEIPSPKSTRSAHSRVNGSSQGALFFPAESQQSFPYSQYPDIRPGTQASISPNDSDDEDEVVAAVVKPTALSRQPALFRSLKEIASQPPNFLKPRLSQYAQKSEEPADMYGRRQPSDDEEDSATESDSETENKSVSHIPTGRLAGIKQTKKI